MKLFSKCSKLFLVLTLCANQSFYSLGFLGNPFYQLSQAGIAHAEGEGESPAAQAEGAGSVVNDQAAPASSSDNDKANAEIEKAKQEAKEAGLNDQDIAELKTADDIRKKIENKKNADAQAKADEDKKAEEERLAQEKAETEKKAAAKATQEKADADAKALADQKAAEEKKLADEKAAQEKATAEAEAKAKAEAEAKAKAEADAKAKADAEAAAKAAQEKADREAKAAEAKTKAEEEVRNASITLTVNGSQIAACKPSTADFLYCAGVASLNYGPPDGDNRKAGTQYDFQAVLSGSAWKPQSLELVYGGYTYKKGDCANAACSTFIGPHEFPGSSGMKWGQSYQIKVVGTAQRK